MKKGLTEYVFVLDCSQDVQAYRTKIIETFNSMIEDFKSREGEGVITTIMFNERSKIHHDRINIQDAKPILEERCVPSGKAALLDAIGHTIKHISTIQKYARVEDKPEHTVFVVISNGEENASKRYTADEIEKAIIRRKERSKWEFIFAYTSLESILTACKVNAQTDTKSEENDYDLDIDDLLRIFENKKS